jgi:hypothetical protein
LTHGGIDGKDEGDIFYIVYVLCGRRWLETERVNPHGVHVVDARVRFTFGGVTYWCGKKKENDFQNKVQTF